MEFGKRKDGQFYPKEGKGHGLDSNLHGHDDSETVKIFEDDFEKADNIVKEYIQGYHWETIKNELENDDPIRMGDFDPENLMGQEEADKKIKVMYLGSLSNSNTFEESIFGGEELDEEAIEESLQDYFFYGKGNEIIEKHLGNEYSLYNRDGDIFITKGLD